MDKHLQKAEKKIAFLFHLVDKIVHYIIKANGDLEKGIDKLNAEIDDTTAHIHEMTAKVDKLGQAVISHEDAIKRNVKLISKIEAFVKED